MTMHFSDIAARAASDKTIAAHEIVALRRAGWSDGTISAVQAEAIFTLNDALHVRSPEWVDFFVEAIGHYVLDTLDPRGYVSDEQADWLIERLKASGKVESMAELELVVRLLEKANNVPQVLKDYVIEVVEREVLTGNGPTRHGGDLSDTYVSEAECRILRRSIFAMASDRPAAVSRKEAEMLFRIKDACVDAPNATDFKRLFAQGVGNYLMGYADDRAQISRERAADLEAFVADTEVRHGEFLRRMVIAAPGSLGVVFGKKDFGPTRSERVAAEGVVTDEEIDWLDEQIDANGEIDEYDQALLDFIAEEDAR